MEKAIMPLIFGLLFVFGWLCSSAYTSLDVNSNIIESPDSASADNSFLFGNRERASPSDWISQDQIKMQNDKVTIELDNPQWAVFTDTNSMDPVIDKGAHAIEVIPKSPEGIEVGDIISYNPDDTDGTIIHRVIEIGNDNEGWYARTKGDNNAFEDPGKIRFSQVRRVLVAIIY